MKRRWLFLVALLALVAAVGTGLAVLWPGQHPNAPLTSLDHRALDLSPSRATREPRKPHVLETHRAGQPKTALPNLRLDSRLATDEGANRVRSSGAQRSKKPADSRWAFYPLSLLPDIAPPSPLDLTLPADEVAHAPHADTDTAAAPTEDDYAKVPADEHAADQALDLSVDQPPTPQVESVNLFKPEYGLRGFMKQNWISQRVALEGGLGLNDDKRIKTDTGLRDDIAVGMGIIVAF